MRMPCFRRRLAAAADIRCIPMTLPVASPAATTFAIASSTTGSSCSPVLIPGPDRFPHVTRGGSYLDKPTDKVNYLRSAARRGSDKSWIKQDPQRPQSIWWLTDGDLVGFRIVRAVSEQDNLKGYRSKIRWESN